MIVGTNNGEIEELGEVLLDSFSGALLVAAALAVKGRTLKVIVCLRNVGWGWIAVDIMLWIASLAVARVIVSKLFCELRRRQDRVILTQHEQILIASDKVLSVGSDKRCKDRVICRICWHIDLGQADVYDFRFEAQ